MNKKAGIFMLNNKLRMRKFRYNISDNFAQNVSEYFLTLDRDMSHITPSEAVDIIPALAAFAEYFESESEWERLTLRALDVLRKGISRNIFHDYASFGGMSHVAYAVSDLVAKTPKLQPFLQAIHKILCDNLTAYLKKTNTDDFKASGNYEVINGLSGPLSYMLNTDADKQMANLTTQIVDVFIARSKDITLLDWRITGWHYYPSKVEKSFMTEEVPNGVINYGLSHGMAGPLATLGMAYKKGMRNEGLDKAISGLFTEFMNGLYYDENDIVQWPGRISVEQYVGLEPIQTASRQQSWCYGSVGILRAMYIAAVATGNSEIEKFAIEEMVKIAEIKLEKYLLTQPIVCHGYIGTAAILDMMYRDTGKSDLMTKVMQMVEVSTEYSKEDFFAAEKLSANERNIDIRATLHQHLEGYSGILQTTLAILKGNPTGHDRRFLIV